MAIQKPDGTYPYRPSNGTEGEMFMERFCYRCKRDAEFQKTGHGEEGCTIVLKTLFLDVDEIGYPPEWISDDAVGLINPRCTAFEPTKGADDE